jgi:hypothetical protein
MESSKTKK